MPSSSNFNLIMIKVINFVRFNITVFLRLLFLFKPGLWNSFLRSDYFLCCSRIARVAGLNDGSKICDPHKKIRRRKNTDSIFRYARVGLSVCARAFRFVSRILRGNI